MVLPRRRRVFALVLAALPSAGAGGFLAFGPRRPARVGPARWKALVADNPDFPGRDDAGLRLARCQEEAGDARGAFMTLLAARTWGDRDALFVIEDRIANVLDAQLSLDETLELARGSKNALI